MSEPLATLRRRALAELNLRLRRRPDGYYVADRIAPGHVVARNADELRQVLTAWLAR
jgi:hypothetical protein